MTYLLKRAHQSCQHHIHLYHQNAFEDARCVFGHTMPMLRPQDGWAQIWHSFGICTTSNQSTCQPVNLIYDTRLSDRHPIASCAAHLNLCSVNVMVSLMCRCPKHCNTILQCGFTLVTPYYFRCRQRCWSDTSLKTVLPRTS